MRDDGKEGAGWVKSAGGTVLIDHGAGVSSNFLHLSRIDVRASANRSRHESLCVAVDAETGSCHTHASTNRSSLSLPMIHPDTIAIDRPAMR